MSFGASRVLVTILVAATLFAAWRGFNEQWPAISLGVIRPSFVDSRHFKPWQTRLNALAGLDEHGRLARERGKSPVACPKQDPGTAVLLLLGQSNAGNHADRQYDSRHPGKVVNYFNSRCYVAGSPLLGATGKQGESWTRLGDNLVDSGAYSRVILVAAAIDGAPIRRWQAGGDLHEMVRKLAVQVASDYRITHVLWHQGERDFADGTTEASYRKMFGSMLVGMRDAGIRAPVFVSVATRCAGTVPWQPDNAVARAQRSMHAGAVDVFPGVDSDALIGDGDRFDGCHFAATGQEKFAAAWAEKIIRHQGIPTIQ